MLKKKTLGFKTKSNKEMILENMRYLSKIKAVRPVYTNEEFEEEERQYQLIKRNLTVFSSTII